LENALFVLGGLGGNFLPSKMFLEGVGYPNTNLANTD